MTEPRAHQEADSSASADIDGVITAWSTYFMQSGADWEQLTFGVTPKESGCGLIFELDNPIDRPLEDLAIADMRVLDFADPHYHLNDETEVYFVLQGTGTVVVGNDIYEVGPHDVVVTQPGTAHYTIPHDQLVLGVVNTPPFDPANYVSIRESDPSVGFEAALFERLSKRETDLALSSALRELAIDLDAWATVLLVPNQRRTLLASRARYNLPDDWAATANFLDSGSMNARVFHSQQLLVENGIDEDGPPTDRPVSRHRMTAAAAVPVPGVGTLEALAEIDDYEFDGARLDRLRATAINVVEILEHRRLEH